MELIRSRKSKLSIDMAPLIDVVFQLLVFFMLTSTFANPSIRINLPKATTQDQIKSEHVVVTVGKQGQIDINGQLTSQEHYQHDLKVLLSGSERKSVHIRGDQEMPYKYFVKIMDLSRQAGAQQVNIVHQKN